MFTEKASAHGRVPLVSTSSLWIAGFQGLFSDPCGVEVYAVTLEKALALPGRELVLIDASASSVEGRIREVLIQFRRWAPDLRPVVISHDVRDDDDTIEVLIGAGAQGYLNASASVEDFRFALENVREGSIWAPRRVLSRLVQSKVKMSGSGESPHSDVVRFTPRENEVIRLLVGGRGNREIGASLGIDHVTVKAHLGRIMRKAGVGNRVELTMFALNQRSGHASQRKPGSLRTEAGLVYKPQTVH